MKKLFALLVVAGSLVRADAATYLLLSQTNAFAAGITNAAKAYTDAHLGQVGGWTQLSTIDTTNYVIGASANVYQTIFASAAVNVAHVTNGPLVQSIRIVPSTDTLCSFTTNGTWLSTNGFAVVGSRYTLTLSSNSQAVLTVTKWSSDSGQGVTNITQFLKVSER